MGHSDVCSYGWTEISRELEHRVLDGTDILGTWTQKKWPASRTRKVHHKDKRFVRLEKTIGPVGEQIRIRYQLLHSSTGTISLDELRSGSSLITNVPLQSRVTNHSVRTRHINDITCFELLPTVYCFSLSVRCTCHILFFFRACKDFYRIWNQTQILYFTFST